MNKDELFSVLLEIKSIKTIFLLKRLNRKTKEIIESKYFGHCLNLILGTEFFNAVSNSWNYDRRELYFFIEIKSDFNVIFNGKNK